MFLRVFQSIAMSKHVLLHSTLHTYIYTHALPISQQPLKTIAIWIVKSSSLRFEKKAGGAATRDRTLGEM